MNRLILTSVCLLTAALSSHATATTELTDVNEAKQRIQVFSKTLKTKLKEAISQGGLSNGVSVCKTEAPKIAAELSSNGWEISRTSLKTRNPLNVPDEWALNTLKYFEQQKANGAPVKSLNKTDYSNNRFRYMQAIPTGALCLACHGKNLSSEVKTALGEHYPKDQATGFSLGDIRGAFSLEQKRYLESL